MSIAMDAACLQCSLRRNIETEQPKNTLSATVRRRETAACLLLLLAGTVLRLIYAFQVPYNVSPHDLGLPSDWVKYGEGHLAYTQYLYQYRGLAPHIRGQFYHPPLFHLVGALIFQLFYTPGGDVEPVFELLQVVNTLFACGIAFVGYRILTRLGTPGKKLVVLTGFLNFCPTLYWLGVTLNNDCLMTLLQAMAIEQTIAWIHRPRTKEIVKIALFLALAMLTKTSAVLLAPAIGCVFLYELIRRIRQKNGVPALIGQFVIFALISIPLGISYVLRNWLCFATPPNYVLDIGGARSPQYVGNCTLLQRLGLPTLIQLFSVRIHWDSPADYCNLWGQTFLTMALDEGILRLSNVFTKCLGGLLVWSGYIVVFLLLSGFIRTLLSRTVDVPIRLVLGVGATVFFFSYCLFAFQYPYICTMNFRYIVNVPVLIAAGYGISSREMSAGAQAILWGYNLLTAALYLFCAV